MAQYFKDFGDNLRSGYHQLKKNKALKGIDDYFDKINAGGGEGLADFAVDMSGIADMYQVGKQGAHIADDLFREGKAWDEVDQGRKDAFERGAYGTALTLAPLPGLKTLGTAGKYATKGLTTAGRNVPGKALAGSGLPKVDKMRRRLEKAHAKAGTSLAPGLSDKAVAKTYRKFKDIPNEDGLRAAYSKLGGNAAMLTPGMGKIGRANQVLGGIPFSPSWRSKFPQRAAAVAMKDWDWGEHPSGMSNPFYRGEYAGQGANDTDVMEQIMGGAFPGQQGGPGKQGQEGTDGMGMSMDDYMEMGIDDPKLGEAISGGSLQAAAAAERLADIAQPDTPATSTSKPASLKDPAPTSVESGAPVFDPRINEFVRAESLSAQEREAFADATADAMKNLDPFNRVQTHDDKGNLRGPGSNWRQQLQRQLDQEKSLKKVQDGYRSERGREGARGSKGYSLPKGYSTSANKGLSDMDIHKAISAHKVAQDNRDMGHIPTAQDILTAPDNPFREFYSDDYLNQLRRETRSDEDYREDTVAGEVPRHELENPAPDTSPIERLQDRQKDLPEMPPLSEPRPIPDDALSFADKLAPHTANEIAKRDAGPEAAQEMQQSLQNLDLSSELEAGKDLIPGLERLNSILPGVSDISSNRPSESDNEMREIEAMLAAEHGQRVSKGLAQREKGMDALWNTRDAWSPEADDAWEQDKQDKYFEENRHKPYDNFVDESGPTTGHPDLYTQALKPTGWTPTEEEREYDHGFPSHSTPSTNGTSTTIRDLNDPAGGQEPSIEELIRELEATEPTFEPTADQIPGMVDHMMGGDALGAATGAMSGMSGGTAWADLGPVGNRTFDGVPPTEPPPFWHDENPGATEESLFDRQELPFEEIQKLSPEDRERYYRYLSAPAGSVLSKEKLLKTMAEKNEELRRHPGLSEFLRP